MLRLPAWIVGGLIEPAWDLYEGSVRLLTMRRLRDVQYESPAALRDLQSRRLKDMVVHAARTSSFYTERFAAAGIEPAGVEDIADLAGLPLLTKDDIRGRTNDILSRDYRREDLVPAKTGGSTGVALHVFCDRRGVQKRLGAALLADTWSGWRPGQATAAIWGNPPVATTWRSRLRTALKDRRIFLDTMKIDDQAIDTFVEQWRALRPGLLFGHAHSLFILAEALDARGGAALRPSGIVATSMMLLDHERELIERVFDRPVTNRYGCEEVSLISCECEEHRGMHLNPPHNWVEFLRDDGSPCAPGQDGRIVVTELVNFGMPMIRYEVGDRGVPSDRACPCGRGYPLMESVTGRVADFLLAVDGSRVAGISLIENTLTRYSGLRQMQLVQDRRHRLTANVVPGPDYGDETAAALVDILRASLGDGMGVEIRLVERIAQERSGKYRFSICTVGPDLRPRSVAVGARAATPPGSRASVPTAASAPRIRAQSKAGRPTLSPPATSKTHSRLL